MLQRYKTAVFMRMASESLLDAAALAALARGEEVAVRVPWGVVWDVAREQYGKIPLSRLRNPNTVRRSTLVAFDYLAMVLPQGVVDGELTWMVDCMLHRFEQGQPAWKLWFVLVFGQFWALVATAKYLAWPARRGKRT